MQELRDKGIEPLLSVKELARALNVPVSWVYSGTRTGRLPHLKLGKYVRFRLGEVLATLEGQRT